MSRTVSPEGLALIKGFEGFRAEPAQLPDGAWVVGYGHVRIGEAGAAVSEAEAAELLALDLAPVERAVSAAIRQELSQAQFDALCSFAFSIGVEAFAHCAVARRANAGKHVAAACAMDAWRKSDASGELEVIDALVRRRAAEKAMYLSGAPCEPAPSAVMRAKLDYAAAVLGAPVEHRPAPDVATLPRPQAKPEAGERLTEILRSEPATEALLLTQVVDGPELEDDGEIVTAHAKPVARATQRQTAAASRAVSAMLVKLSAEPKKLRMPRGFKLPRFDVVRSLETMSLVALLGFGSGLVALAIGALTMGQLDFADLLGASALGAPGLFAVFLALYGLVKGPARQAA